MATGTAGSSEKRNARNVPAVRKQNVKGARRLHGAGVEETSRGGSAHETEAHALQRTRPGQHLGLERPAQSACPSA